jgi:hypothetical protein
MAAPATKTYRAIPVNPNVNPINAGGAANVVLIAAQGAGIKIQVWALKLAVSTVTTVTFKSGANALTGPMPISALVLDAPTPDLSGALPHFETNANESFNINVGDASGVLSGDVVWSAMGGL